MNNHTQKTYRISDQILADMFKGGSEHHLRIEFGWPPDTELDYVENGGEGITLITVSSNMWTDPYSEGVIQIKDLRNQCRTTTR